MCSSSLTLWCASPRWAGCSAAAREDRSGRLPMTKDAAPFLRVTEIFHSVQGESTWAGLPCTFIRLTGCPLRCTWCDTEYAFHGGERMYLEDIIARIDEIGTRLVEVTGGEPLIHRNAFVLISRLLE